MALYLHKLEESHFPNNVLCQICMVEIGQKDLKKKMKMLIVYDDNLDSGELKSKMKMMIWKEPCSSLSLVYSLKPNKFTRRENRQNLPRTTCFVFALSFLEN